MTSICRNFEMVLRAMQVYSNRLNEDVETAKDTRYLGNALNSNGGSEMTVVARTRIDWMKFRECGEVLGRRSETIRYGNKT